jgi:hypothetical protein
MADFELSRVIDVAPGAAWALVSDPDRLTLDDIDLPNRHVILAGHRQRLGEFTHHTLLTWLEHQHATWPTPPTGTSSSRASARWVPGRVLCGGWAGALGALWRCWPYASLLVRCREAACRARVTARAMIGAPMAEGSSQNVRVGRRSHRGRWGPLST